MTIMQNLTLKAAVFGVWLLAIMAVGCGTTAVGLDGPSQPKGKEFAAGVEKSAPGAKPVVQPAAIAAGEVTAANEIWEAYFIQGSKVGHAHTFSAPLEEGGQKLIQTTTQSQMSIRRLGQTIVQKLSLSSTEDAQGNVIACSQIISAGGGEMSVTGKVSGGKLKLETQTLGKKQSQEIEWKAGTGGYFAPDQSLRQKPLKPGEKRTITSLLPIMNVVGKTELEGLAYEEVKLLGDSEPKKLLKVRSFVDLPGGGLESFLWMDERGEALKSLVPGMKQEANRTTKEVALGKSSGANLDLMTASVVKLKGKVPNLATAKRVVYKVSLKEGKLAGILGSGLGQQVKLTGEQTAEVTVRLVLPGYPKLVDVEQTKPTAEDSAANSYVQSDDAEVLKLAKQLGEKADKPWEVAQAAEQLVHAKIRKKDFSQAFATAAEVARSLEGDCTEHAVLLAAICRARKIPARVALGLIHVRSLGGFAFHMWNEVWIEDRWVPLDATLGQGGATPDHLKLVDSSLSGANAFTAVLPVVRAMGQLELEVLQSE